MASQPIRSRVMKNGIDRLAERLSAFRHSEQVVYLYPHVSLDGDALGSSLALLLVLEALDIRVCLPLDEPIPSRLDFLPALDRITWLDNPCTGDGLQALALLIDCSEPGRLGRRRALCEQAGERWALDHHVAQRLLLEQDVVDTQAAAAAELVHDLIRSLETLCCCSLLNPACAALLMTALISDTGGFVFSNTTKKTFAIASDLMDDDLDLRQITYRLFHQSSLARLRLMGWIFSNARFSQDGKIVLASIGQDLMQSVAATDDDLDGIIGHLRNVAGVELAIILRQQPDQSIRINIRSGLVLDAARFAASFGGGGHPRAAGMTLTGLSLEEAVQAVLEKAGELL